MKKFIAILLAVLTVISATSMMAFAETFKCDKCGKIFETTTEYNNHLDEEKAAADAAAAAAAAAAEAKAKAEAEAAAAAATPKETFKCDYCEATFDSSAALKTHIDERFAVVGHFKACTNWIDKDLDGVKDEGECCTDVFTTKVAFDAHAAECKFKDTRSDADKMKDAFEAGNYVAAIKYLFKVIISFVQSAEFKNALEKVTSFVKGINFDKVVSTVKDAVSKLPLDKVGDLIKK